MAGDLRREREGGNFSNSPRGSRSAGSRETAEGRIRGLAMKLTIVNIGSNSPHTTSVLVDFGGVDKRHNVWYSIAENACRKLVLSFIKISTRY
jgi:hypothetical protein